MHCSNFGKNLSSIEKSEMRKLIVFSKFLKTWFKSVLRHHVKWLSRNEWGSGLLKLMKMYHRILKTFPLKAFAYFNICWLATIRLNQLWLLVDKTYTNSIVVLSNFFIRYYKHCISKLRHRLCIIVYKFLKVLYKGLILFFRSACLKKLVLSKFVGLD